MSRARSARILSLGLVTALLLASFAEPLLAQSGIIRPRRMVKVFDFEEPDNYESLPKNWFIIGRPAETSDSSFFKIPLHHDLMELPGYPSFTQVRFDERHAVSGRRCLYLGLNGGSAGAFLEVGSVPAVPQSDYLVTAYVRTESLRRASASLIAYFIDRDGHRIDQSFVQTRPVRTLGEWTQVAVKLRGDTEGAVWIGLEARIRQPKPNPNDPLGDQRVVLKDVKGEAWFDDITIWQLPRIEVATQSKVNLIRDPEKPRVSVSVRDLTSHSLAVDLIAYDHNLRPAAVSRRILGPGDPRYWTWEPDLPGYGWFLLDMQVRDQASDTEPPGSTQRTPVARTFGAFVWLPPGKPIHSMDAQRFQVLTTGLDSNTLAFLPDLLDSTGLRYAVLSIWDRQTTLGDIEQRKDEIDDLMRWVYMTGRQAALSFEPIPTSLAESLNNPTADPQTVLGADRSQWLAYLTPTLLSHGQRVQRWFLGSPQQAYGFHNPNLPAEIDHILAQFTSLAPSPELVIPWRIDQSRRPGLPDSLHYLIDVSPGVTADKIPEHLQQWSDIRDKLTLYLREPPADKVSHARRVTDLAIRMVNTWELDPGALAVADLWTHAAQRDPALVPDPLLGVFSNVAHQLAGRRVLGRLPLTDGLHSLILDGPAGPALATWTDHPGAASSTLNLFLGQDPVAVDVWGNRTRLPISAGKHQFIATGTPSFITGIDAELAMFRAGFSIDDPFIESTQSLHERTITLTNPWPMTISGHLRITGPEGCTPRPTRHVFSIPAGRSVTLPVALSFPVSEVAGPKQLTARLEFTADEPMVIDLALPIEVGLHDVTFNATVATTPGADGTTLDATAAAVVTNTGTETLSLYVFANLRGYPIQERIIADLEPGQTAVRRFRIQGAGQALRDTAMRLGIREVDGPRILNQKLSTGDLD